MTTLYISVFFCVRCIEEVKSRGNFDYVFLGKFVPISSYTPAESKVLYNEILLDALVYAFLVCLA